MRCNKLNCIHRPACEAWEFMGNENNINSDPDNCDWYQSKRDIEREVENEIRQEVQEEHDRELAMVVHQARELIAIQQRDAGTKNSYLGRTWAEACDDMYPFDEDIF